MTYRRLHDHLDRPIDVPHQPQRIISLCPSLTETLFALGLGARIVGRTRFCIHPKPQIREITRLGGTKQLHYERLHQLKPDLIIAEKEENTPEMVETLARDYPVYVIDVQTIDDAMAMILDLGTLTDTRLEAEAMQQQIRAAWAQLPTLPGRRVAYLIWQDPLMGVGRDTYIQSVLARLGLRNVLLDLEGRYPQLDPSTLRVLSPEWVLLSSEPYPFREKHLADFRALLPTAEVQLVDGEMFSWYGARMLAAASYLKAWSERA